MTFDQVQEKLRRDEGIRVGRVVLGYWAGFSEWNISDGETLETYDNETDALKAFLQVIN